MLKRLIPIFAILAVLGSSVVPTQAEPTAQPYNVMRDWVSVTGDNLSLVDTVLPFNGAGPSVGVTTSSPNVAIQVPASSGGQIRTFLAPYNGYENQLCAYVLPSNLTSFGFNIWIASGQTNRAAAVQVNWIRKNPVYPPTIYEPVMFQSDQLAAYTVVRQSDGSIIYTPDPGGKLKKNGWVTFGGFITPPAGAFQFTLSVEYATTLLSNSTLQTYQSVPGGDSLAIWPPTNLGGASTIATFCQDNGPY